MSGVTPSNGHTKSYFMIIIIIIIIIIMNLFIEGSLISAQAVFSLRALVGATRIHSYMRMASLRRQSDLIRDEK